MGEHVTFYRLTKTNTDSEFIYSNRTIADTDRDHIPVTLNRTGFNQYIEIHNNTGEAVMLSSSLRATPTIIPPIVTSMYGSGMNEVIVNIYTRINTAESTAKKTANNCEVTSIRVSGRKLISGAVFISEIGSYLSTYTNHHAVAQTIGHDSTKDDWEELSVYMDNSKANPAKIYSEFRELTEKAIARRGPLQIRVGSKQRAKDFHISILDSYFHPANDHKLVYDPSLSYDRFVIEYVRGNTILPFEGSFDELDAHGMIFIDQNTTQTISGKFCNMVIFASEKKLVDYFHEKKSVDRFDQEKVYLAKSSGDMRLKNDIQKLNDEKRNLEGINARLENDIAEQKTINGDLKSRVKFLEHQLSDLKNGGAHEMSADAFYAGLEATRIRLENERIEMAHKQYLSQVNFDSAVAKNKSDMWKNVLGIVTAIVAGATAIVAGWLKLKSVKA